MPKLALEADLQLSDSLWGGEEARGKLMKCILEGHSDFSQSACLCVLELLTYFSYTWIRPYWDSVSYLSSFGLDALDDDCVFVIDEVAASFSIKCWEYPTNKTSSFRDK